MAVLINTYPKVRQKFANIKSTANIDKTFLNL